MGVSNSLISKKANDKVVEFEVNGQTVKLSPAIIRNYLVNGNGNVSDQEVVMFLNLCKFNRLNPFLREAYLIKYGSSPATMMLGKDAITKRAMRNPSAQSTWKMSPWLEAGPVSMSRATGTRSRSPSSLTNMSR